MAIFELGETGAVCLSPTGDVLGPPHLINLVVTSLSFPSAGREVAPLVDCGAVSMGATDDAVRMRNGMIQINAAARLPPKEFAQ